MPPEEFEQRRQGDCDDFALWTWRQLLALGHQARFVCGQSGRYGVGHAWVTFERDGRTYIVEALVARAGPTFPRLSTLRYKPNVSVTWDGNSLRYYEHEHRGEPRVGEIAPHLPEWMLFWLRTRPKAWVNRFLRLFRTAKRTAKE